MAEQTVKLTLSKSTKGTHVYANDSETAPVSSVYIKRTALPATPPPVIEMTIAWEEA